MKAFFRLLLILGLASSFSTMAVAKGKGQNRARMMNALKEAGVDKATIEKIKTLNKEQREKMKASREAMKKAHEEFQAALSTDKSDGDLKKLHDKVVSSKSAQMNAFFDQMMKIRQLLNAEQRKKFAEHMQPRGK